MIGKYLDMQTISWICFVSIYTTQHHNTGGRAQLGRVPGVPVTPPPPPWHCKPFFKQTTYNIQYLKFLKKLWCCLGGEYNRVIQADILSISPSLIVLFSSSVTIAYYLHTVRIDNVKQIMRVNYNWLKKLRDQNPLWFFNCFIIVKLFGGV